MPISRNTPFVLDTDTDPNKLQANNARALVNVFLEQGYATGCFGNRRIFADFEAGEQVIGATFEGTTTPTVVGPSRCVAACWDAEAQAAYYFLHNTTSGHRIVRYRPAEDTQARTVLRWAGLNLPATSGVAQPCITDGLLLYLDAAGETRCVPVARALTGHYSAARLAAEPTCLHLAKPPAFAAPTAERLVLATAPGNQVAAHAYQFATRFRYRDGEVSVFSPLSAVNFPRYRVVSGQAVADDANALRVALPAAWPSLADELELLVRQDEQTGWLVAARLTRDAAGEVPTAYDFAGPTTGEAVDAADDARAFEADWPGRALTLAGNRVWKGNLTEGYATPQPQLTATVSAIPAGAGNETVWRVAFDRYVSYNDPVNGDVTEKQEAVYFYALETGAYPDAASTYRAASVDGAGYTVNTSVAALSYAAVFVTPQPGEDGSTRVVTTLPGQVVKRSTSAAALVTQPTVPERSTYYVGVQFYDALGRPGGVGSRTAVTTGANPQVEGRCIAWTLGAADPTAEIPAWAHTYQLCLSQNASKVFFRQLPNPTMRSYLGANADGSPNLVGAGSTAGTQVWVALNDFDVEGLGYTYVAGSNDRLRFVGEEGQDYPILKQETFGGKVWAVIGRRLPQGWAPPADPRIEIYTPAAIGGAEAAPYHERGPRYAVVRSVAAGVESRRYSVAQGVLDGDAWRRPSALSDGVLLEAVAPSPQPQPVWLDATRGRPADALPAALQRTVLPTALRFSNVRLAGTRSNGLATWEPGNIEDVRVPRELGPLRALTVADDTQAQGAVLLAVCEGGAASIGLSTAQLRESGGEALNVDTDRVIGYVNVLRGGLGTQDPQTVAAHAGQVWGYDRRRRVWWRYAQNGMTDLGEQFNFRARTAAAATQTLSGAAYDWQREEALLLTGPAALVMDERRKHGADTRTLPAEQVLGTPYGLLAWKDGQLWRHDAQAPRCSFFNVYTTPRIDTVFCDNAAYAKRFHAVSVEGPALWLPVAVSTDTGGASVTKAAWFERREGVWRAALRGNQNAPGFASPAAALHEGPPLDGTRALVSLTPPVGQEAQPLSAVSLSWQPRSGQQMAV